MRRSQPGSKPRSSLPERALIIQGEAAGFELFNLCVWVKTNGGMGGLYRSQHELVPDSSDETDEQGRATGCGVGGAMRHF
jgi:hypothetical protein